MVGIYGSDHPTANLSTYINDGLFSGRLRENMINRETIVQHDVWVGQGAVILKGIEIGCGAVIGAGAVVTKPVPNFAIVVGNPARILRFRFSEKVIEGLLHLSWWDLEPKQLSDFEDIFKINLQADENASLAAIIAAIERKKAVKVVFTDPPRYQR